MQQSVGLNKKPEEIQRGYEEWLMIFKLKWMAFTDGTDLNITNWGFTQSIKKHSSECPVISSLTYRRNPIDGVRSRGQVFTNLKYKIIYLK